MTEESEWQSIICLKKLDLMLENTKFGYVISGKIPQCLVNNVKDIQMDYNVPAIQMKKGGDNSMLFLRCKLCTRGRVKKCINMSIISGGYGKRNSFQ